MNNTQSITNTLLMYLHGLEGTPNGTKGRWMQTMFGAIAPLLPAKRDNPEAFRQSVSVAKDAVARYQPKVIVGSSFGGAVLMQLLIDGIYDGPSVLLAQAGVKYGVAERLPEDTYAILIHAPDDDIVPFEDSVRLQEQSGAGVELWPTEGDHRLHHITKDGTLERAIRQCLSHIEQSTRF